MLFGLTPADVMTNVFVAPLPGVVAGGGEVIDPPHAIAPETRRYTVAVRRMARHPALLETN
jgi:hypothetical protein